MTDLDETVELSVNSRFRVNEFNEVYDSDGVFFCRWDALTDIEKEVVKLNPYSFY